MAEQKPDCKLDQPMTIAFTVLGEAITQGSKKVIPIMRGGAPVMKNGRALTRAVNDNPKLSGWRQEIAQVGRAAFSEVTGDDEPELLKGPVFLSLTFFRPRPKSHYGTGRNANVLKQSAPEYPIQRPDTLKLGRAVEDALTRVVWLDDSQVVVHHLVKKWGLCSNVRVEITAITALVENERITLPDAERRALERMRRKQPVI